MHTFTHIVTPLGNVLVLQRGNPSNRQKITGASQTHTRAHIHTRAECTWICREDNALSSTVIAALREHPRGCFYTVDTRKEGERMPWKCKREVLESVRDEERFAVSARVLLPPGKIKTATRRQWTEDSTSAALRPGISLVPHEKQP